MKRKMIWLVLVTMLLALIASAGVVRAQESANYDLTLNSLAGGMQSSEVMTSTAYTLVANFGPMVRISTTNANYELCTGFVCQSDKGFFQIWLPSMDKSDQD